MAGVSRRGSISRAMVAAVNDDVAWADGKLKEVRRFTSAASLDLAGRGRLTICLNMRFTRMEIGAEKPTRSHERRRGRSIPAMTPPSKNHNMPCSAARLVDSIVLRAGGPAGVKRRTSSNRSSTSRAAVAAPRSGHLPTSPVVFGPISPPCGTRQRTQRSPGAQVPHLNHRLRQRDYRVVGQLDKSFSFATLTSCISQAQSEEGGPSEAATTRSRFRLSMHFPTSMGVLSGYGLVPMVLACSVGAGQPLENGGANAN